MTLEFQRTLRIPDDDRTHHLPPGLGAFALRHVDDFRPVHNLESLAQLTAVLAYIGPRREEGLTTWQGMAAA